MGNKTSVSRVPDSKVLSFLIKPGVEGQPDRVKGGLADGTILSAIGLIWLLLATAFGYFRLVSLLPIWAAPLIPVSLTFAISILLLGVPRLRLAIKRIPLAWLVSTAFIRGLSFYIGYLALLGQVPASFAVPVELGVLIVIIGTLLLLMFCRPLGSEHRSWLIIWNLVGAAQIVSILLIVGWHIAIGEAPIFFATLPLNLFPTFVVPLSLTAHILIIYRIRQF